MADEDAEELAKLITRNPKVRTEYFENPGKVLARAIPRQGLLERISLGDPERTGSLRAGLGEKVEAIISGDPRLISIREAAFEKDVFLNEALRKSQGIFNAIVGLSILAFFVGMTLVVTSLVTAVVGGGSTQNIILASLSGAGGVVTTLGSFFALARTGLSETNANAAVLEKAGLRHLYRELDRKGESPNPLPPHQLSPDR